MKKILFIALSAFLFVACGQKKCNCNCNCGCDKCKCCVTDTAATANAEFTIVENEQVDLSTFQKDADGYYILFDGKTLKSRITAENIKYDSLGRWKLNNYTLRKFNGLKETMTQGATLDTMLNFEPRDFLISKNDEQTMTSPELRQYIDQQHARGVAGIMNFEVEYERRYAMTAAAFILTVIGLSLSSRKVRGGMGLNIGIGLLLSFSYILFMTVTSTFAVSGYTSARVAMWIPNIVYTIIAVWLYRRSLK